MLSPKTKYDLTNAKAYFEEHLCAGDYYSENEKIAGQWIGNGSAMLNLAGDVRRKEFTNLCDNLDPHTGKRLTQRLKTKRTMVDEHGIEYETANRRVFYDFTFSPPKSVSIVALLGNDGRIVEAHRQAIVVALGELEKFAGTRVHQGKDIKDRNTGNFICAIFQHDTSRALDPHLHSHCVIFNATYDQEESRWKALQNFEMLRAQKYIENVYYHELARALHGFGYEIENNPRGDFEIKRVDKQFLLRFSKRHQEIDERTHKMLVQKPHLANENIKDVREHIAHDRRQRKIKGIKADTLRELWNRQISPSENQALQTLKDSAERKSKRLSQEAPLTALAWAEEHVFDRLSVVPEYEIWRHALEHARGKNMTVQDIHEATQKRGYIRDQHGPRTITTKIVLRREWEIVCLAKNGIAQFKPLAPEHTPSNLSLDQDQQHAAARILSSRNFVTLFRGGAGTGKSYTLREVKKGLIEAGHRICVIAPQRQQVIDLKRDGLGEAQTVSEFLARKEMAHGAILIVDEAGQIGAKQMHALLSYAEEKGGRVILSGDTRQHGAVEASDALRAIERYSGIRAVELNEIRRQDPARAKTAEERLQIQQYRNAVKEASEGKLGVSFDILNRQGVIESCSLLDQQARLAQYYTALAQKNHSTVVVSQTWSEVHAVNGHIRAALKSAGLIGSEERTVNTLEPVDLTNAQKRDRRFYDENAVICFNRKAVGFKKGQSCRFIGITPKGVILEGTDRISTVPFKFVDRFNVYRPRELALATGDRLQLKNNARTRQGQRIANGELVTVKKILTDGRIELEDGRTLEKDYRQFVRGFAITSYASQGKTVDYILFSDSAIKVATNQQQWYVTISRGRRGIKIFTSDKEQLRENIMRSGGRSLAMDLIHPFASNRIGISQGWFEHIRRIHAFAAIHAHRIGSSIYSRYSRPTHKTSVKIGV